MNTTTMIGVIIVLVAIMSGIIWNGFNKQEAARVAQPSVHIQTPAPAREPTPPTPLPAGNPAVPSQAPSSASETLTPKSFAVNGSDNGADLTTITVAAGTPVTITFGADENGTYHGGLDFRSSIVNTGTIAPGSSKSVSFTATKSFSFTPYWPATNIAKPYKINVVVQ